MATQKRRSTAAKRTNQKRKTQSTGDVRLRSEILFLIILAFSILLLISHFGLGGFVGRKLSALFFGIFGFPAYAFPVIFFIGFLFIMSNRQNPRMPRKVIGGAGLYMFICALFQLLMNGYERAVRIRDYFMDSSFDRMGGGLVGGVITRIFGGLFGTVGAYVLVVAGLIIFAIIMTQEPLLAIMRDKSGRLYQAAADRTSEHRAQASQRSAARATKRAERKKEAVPVPEDEPEEVMPVRPIRVRGASDQIQEADAEDKILSALRQELDPDLKAEATHKMTKRFSIWPEGEAGDENTQPETTADEPAEAGPIREEPPRERRTARKKADRTARATETEAEPLQLELPLQDAEEDKPFRFPPLSLLRAGNKDETGETTAQLNETAEKLQRVLKDFSVNVQITDVSRGPSVTRYELHPEQGVKVSKILSLQDDIKLNLAAADIRIEAPIPGKAAIGIEVPNKSNSTVTLRDMLASKQYQQSRAKLAFAVGMDIAGKPVVTDIAKMPHLLIAGATGSGKSVCINTLIMSILYRCSPEDVKMIMIDPKMVELSVYNGLPHLYIPVVTDTKKAAGALNWAVTEMGERYNRFAGLGVRDIQGYNDKIAQIPVEEGEERPAKMPRVVIILDELADLMMVSKHEVEDAIIQLAQLARAAGIHLVIATQRPSVDVITGLIKANMPSRIALAVSSGTDSRTILDMNGAEKLLGKGDMLFYPQDYPKPARVQGAFVTDGEIEEVVSFLTEKNETTNYDEKVEAQISTAATSVESPVAASDSDRDVYFEEAGRLIIEKDKASIGMLQRAFKIGFNRAARIMDQLCDAGVVGEEEGTKPRRILMDMASFEAVLGEEA